MQPETPDPLELVRQATESSTFQDMAPPLQIALFLGAMAFLTAALVSLTSFTRIIIVLSFVRRAQSTQEIPPNPVMIGLAIFLTLFVMGPTFDAIARQAISPYLNEEISGVDAVRAGGEELKTFMLAQTRKADIALFAELAGGLSLAEPRDTPMRVLIPAFMISELKTAFIMGFCLYIPFLLIDLVVSTVLMSLGMMMMPPVVVSLPFKILLFVLIDGWRVIVSALSASFA